MGIFLVACGVHFFKAPNNFTLGGVTGISIILAAYYPNAPISLITLVLNTFLILIGFIFLGKNTIVRTIYGSYALSFFLWVLEKYYPILSPLTNDKLLELIYAVFLPGIGSAILFHYNANTGGTDILVKIINKYTNISMGMAGLIIDAIITVFSGQIFGTTIMLYTVLGVVFKSFLLDNFLESLQIKKIVVIISEKPDDILAYITNTIHRGATVQQATGAFTGTDKSVITAVVDRRQAYKIQQFARMYDPSSFITITNSSTIFGRGFSM